MILSVFHSYTPKTHLRIRRALRRLCNVTDARLAVVRTEGKILEYDGDEQAIPTVYPALTTSIGCVHRTQCRDGEHVVASARVRIAAGWPTLDVYVVAPSTANPDTFAALDTATESIEDAVFAKSARIYGKHA